jgi:hypothetical protein
MELVFMGNETIPDNVIATWNTQKNEDNKFNRLKDTERHIIQGAKNEQLNQLKYVDQLYETQKVELLNKDAQIKLLEEELDKLGRLSIPFADISAEAKTNYENLQSLGFSPTILTDFNKLNTIPVFEIKWKHDVERFQTVADSKKLHEWLKLRLKDSTIQLKEVVQD